MKITHYTQVPPDPVGEEGAEGITVRWVIGPQDGAPNFLMRVFEMAPGGHSPHHAHPWEHEVFVLEGQGTLVHAGQEITCSPGDVVYLAPGEEHQFRNTSGADFAFICLIPKRK
jgi:quercetin dioxygenase-like cupin family protein